MKISLAIALLSALTLSFVGNSAVAQAPQAASTTSAYRINPGDELEVYVWGDERLQRVVKVLPDGSFSFPLAGRIDALQKLPGEVETQISQALAGQYQGTVPGVTVSVRNPFGLQFSVVGKVKTPGTFTPGRYVNALEALSFAGGPNEFAQLNGVMIIRKEGNRLRAFRVPLSNVLKAEPSQAELSALPQLQGGDTVIVP